ncbi:GntR family transcriptional regulator [Actinomadura geliboluensis]|uniref:GntR family transcriptional regulator n=1 Tax=Actinomadura geliboluensis TaxID=882440 RepID=A0A5S4H5Y1_9ACTN|nr:GntR family transcriptional regulator [Actinomadura geliboluensis]TMR40638.1 GntR family transcriptional regulator [Actinomadura geliboluensis]
MTESPATLPLPDGPAFREVSVGQEVREYIRHMIMTRRFKPGDRLRVEHLAEQMKISVTPVREALVELAGEGFLVRRPRRGYVVARLTRAGFEDRVLVLAMVAGELAKRAAVDLEDGTLANLRDLQGALVKADRAGDRDAAEEINHRFHSTVNLAARSPELAWTAERFSRYLPRYGGLDWQARPRTCTYAHEPILDALAAKDPDAARAAMFDHLIASTKTLADELERGGLWAEAD